MKASTAGTMRGKPKINEAPYATFPFQFFGQEVPCVFYSRVWMDGGYYVLTRRESPIDYIPKKSYVLTLGRMLGVKLEQDDELFEEKIKAHPEELSKLLAG